MNECPLARSSLKSPHAGPPASRRVTMIDKTRHRVRAHRAPLAQIPNWVIVALAVSTGALAQLARSVL